MSSVPQYSDDSQNVLISTLRLLVAIPVFATFIPAAIIWRQTTSNADCLSLPLGVQPVTAVIIVFIALALALLYIPTLPQRMGRWFLPTTLLLCTLGPLSGLAIYLLTDAGFLGGCAQVLGVGVPVHIEVWPASFFLLIPLMVIGWQYTYRHVALYSIALLLFDLSLVVMLARAGYDRDLDLISALSIFRTIVFLLCGYVLSLLVAEQRKQKTALVEANNKLAEHALTLEKLAVSQERNRLARDLHDTLAHYMSGLVLELEGTRLLWPKDEEKARQNLDDSIDTARMGLVETRRALKALRASTLDDLGLLGAIRELVKNAAKRNQWQVSMTLPEEPLPLLPETEEALYRIVQEATTNIERHAHADAVTIQITHNEEMMHLHIKDDGRGFQADEVAQKGRFGLGGMTERASLVGGQLTVASNNGEGTSVRGILPLINEKDGIRE